MNKRYEVIAAYPNSPFKEGDILIAKPDFYFNKKENSNYHDISQKDIALYPHIFKPLKWWEKRKLEEMPEYVKEKDSGDVWNNVVWHRLAGTLFFTTKPFKTLQDKKLDWWNPHSFLPATEQEYLTFKNIQV